MRDPVRWLEVFAIILAAIAAGLAVAPLWHKPLPTETRPPEKRPDGPTVARAPKSTFLQRPICPDQWIAQRGLSEPWRVKCVVISTEGPRAPD